jgi:hypothetical protein
MPLWGLDEGEDRDQERYQGQGNPSRDEAQRWDGSQQGNHYPPSDRWDTDPGEGQCERGAAHDQTDTGTKRNQPG